MRSDAPDRPDILLIVSDDHGYADRSARGSTDARTPHLDRLAREGTVFDQGYVTAPICSPSRAGLIAGAHQQRWGARWFDTSAFPPPHQPVIPEVLQQAGYRTGYFGKVHYGPERPGDRACPENHGFDESLYGLAGLSMGRLHYLHHSRAAAEEYGEAAPAHGVDPLRENGREVECEQHLTVEFTDRALEFMGEGGEEQDPYFCMVAYNAVHNFAWQLPQDELDARALPVTTTSILRAPTISTGTTERSRPVSSTGASTTSRSSRSWTARSGGCSTTSRRRADARAPWSSISPTTAAPPATTGTMHRSRAPSTASSRAG
jgi:arylsulfatase A-like enzyme